MSAAATSLYASVRSKEGRIYTDDVVRDLPETSPTHPHRAEWRARAASCNRLTRYFVQLKMPLRVLDLGCGNGWLASRIACLQGTRVVGLDRDNPELEQACRVFSNATNLSWVAADIFEPPFPEHAFDAIVIASAIQYFRDLRALLMALMPMLSKRGEIHILDSPLYKREDLDAARERSRNYYARLGFPEMSRHYNHHCVDILEEQKAKYLYKPDPGTSRPADKLLDSPFPWICLGRRFPE